MRTKDLARSLLTVASMSLILITHAAAEPVAPTEAFTLGTPFIDVRLRSETVNEENDLRNASANTLRTRAGFRTADHLRLSGLIELEDVRAVGSDRYNSTINGNTGFSTVPDPEGTEVNQAYVRLQLDNTLVRFGRQRVVFDNSRYVGNVDFRQNEQTYDGLMLLNTSLPGSRIIYSYMTKARRFLGEDNPRGELEMSTHLLNYSYKRLNGDRLTTYGYFLEMDDPALAPRSTKTLGLRYKGSVDLAATKFLYTLEYADQSPYADGANTNSANYYLIEAGAKFRNEWTARVGQESLGGNGVYGFQTPLATAHAFNGIADIFAQSTPRDGLVDNYLSLAAPVLGMTLEANYHDFSSDSNDIEYGSEFDLELNKKFGKHYRLGLAFAAYSADQFGFDTNKLWLWTQVAF